ncbi:MAG: serine/threonine-protein kinase, partial [Gemmatimonadota bacterium]
MTDPGNAANRWERIDALFAAALERPPNEREAFLSQATGGDSELAREVQSLLDSLDTAERRIGESADGLGAISGALGPLAEPFLLPGTRIGAYAIVQEIGRGGMGEVYLAERADRDFDRRVAIKLVRTDAAARAGSVVQRFHAERRILAGLEHPNIARLYDSGVTPDGRPYLVMEHVAGERIDRYAVRRNLSLRDRLTLFERVCDAVTFAHQRLVIHRDIKPGNILVTDDGRVTLLDFGIARLLGGDDDGEAATRPGVRVLTPEYASPEQVRGDPPNATMDVYALGVVLHELLTGARPAWQRLVATGAETAQVEAAMSAPSAAASAPDRRSVRGDLDTIVLSALAPNPSRRYASVHMLRDDLRRYRAGEPILARPASIGYRAAKFVRRNPVAVTAGALVATLAIGFVASTLIQSRRVGAERDRANSERDRAQQTAQLLINMFKTGDPFAPGRPDTMRVAQFLEQGVERVNAELGQQPLARAQLLTALGDVYRWRGDHQRATGILDTAIALYRAAPAPPQLELAEALTQLGNVRRLNGNFVAAESLHREALQLRERAIWSGAQGQTIDERPIAASLANIGAIFIEQGKLDEAAPLIDSALTLQRRRSPIDTASVAEILNYKATVFFRRGDEQKALATILEGHALNRARLGADHPRVALELGNVAVLLGRQGRVAEAESALVEAARVLESRLAAEHPQTVRAKANLAGLKGSLGKLTEADSLFRVVIDIDRRATNELRVHLPIALDMHADVLKKLGRSREAQASYREALALNRALNGEQHPSVAFAEIKLANALCEAPTVAEREAALAGYQRGRRVLDGALPGGHPNRLGARGQHGDCLSRTGNAAAGEAEMRPSFEEAVKTLGAAHTITQAIGTSLRAHYERTGRTAARDSIQA